MLVIPGTGYQVMSFRRNGHGLFQWVLRTLSVVEETGFIVSAELHIVHIRTFTCHPFAIDCPVIVGIGIQKDATYNVSASLGSGKLCLWSTKTTE